MGRRKITSDKKKNKLSITISKENFDKFEVFGICNKSKTIEYILCEYFNN